jgi:hypothetical protein
MEKFMKISKEELDRPIIKKSDGTLATLKELLEERIIVKDDMTSEDFRDLALARYGRMDPEKALVLGKVSYTKDQILEEIQKGSDAGVKFVEMQANFVRMLLERRDEIEIP